MRVKDSLSAAQARRIALCAQGFNDPPHARPTMRTLERTVARTGVLQVDSVNVLARAHLMPLYARMGPYDTGLLARAADAATVETRRLVEYLAHVQAYMPVELWPLMRHRMEECRARQQEWWGGALDPVLAAALLARIRAEGAATARQLEEHPRGPKEKWGWNWSTTRKTLDYLYAVGDLAIVGRTAQFENRCDLTERVIPSRVLEMATPQPQAAVTDLVRLAARSLGVATARSLADYYRLRTTPRADYPNVRTAIEVLVEAGELLAVQVEGWSRPGYLHSGARIPRQVTARTVLSPFDPLVWERDRAEDLFGFRYRIEIYTPAAQRVHGYYVLPFLLDDALVARVDLSADRSARHLVVQAAHAEPGAPDRTAEELTAELWRLAGWLGLERVVVRPRGDLAARLASVVAASR